MIESHQHPKIGWFLTALGVGMMLLSFVLAVAFQTPAAILHNVLQVGGLLVAVVGLMFVAGFFYRGSSE